MSDSYSQRIVVILDCCNSGAFTNGMTSKGDKNIIDIKAELGGEGRAILMSSSSTQSSFESESSELSIYTKYIVKGIKTGEADIDGDGKISVSELHQYASQNVSLESPTMTPQFFAIMEGEPILLARSPKLKYRGGGQETVPINDDGKIDLSESPNKDKIPKQESPKSFNPLSKIQVGYLILGIVVLLTILSPFLPSLKLPPEKQQNLRYSTLENLLKQKKWKEADKETREIMVKAGSRKDEDWLDEQSIKNIPCPVLRAIDQLWVEHSDGKFGFSVQKEIYQSLDGTEEYNPKIVEEFDKKVGWRKGDEKLTYNELTFDLGTHYRGHLPYDIGYPAINGLFFSYVDTCGL